MSRFRQWIWFIFGVGGAVTLSSAVLVTAPASAEATTAEERTLPASDAGSDALVGDASADAGSACPDGGCPPSEKARAERDAGEGDAIAEGKAPAQVDGEPKPRPTRVVVDSISFENGEVPRAQVSLEKLANQELAACASERGGVQGEGTVELKFLVRARGRAEGVDVGKVRNVPAAVVHCLATTLARRPIGAPSDEPVGVTATLKLIDDKAQERPKPGRTR